MNLLSVLVKINAAAPLALLLTVLGYSTTFGGVLSKSLQTASIKDTVCNVWVFFNDASPRGGAVNISKQALTRRLAAGFTGSASERAVNGSHIREIERRGGALRRVFSWENAASFSAHSSTLNEIASLPFVKSVSPVAVYVRKNVNGHALTQRKSAATEWKWRWHMDMVNVPLAHDYLRVKKMGSPGSGVFIAFFDGGFRLEHKVFDHIRKSGSVISVYDFVDDDTLVYDPDSVAKNSSHKYHKNDAHGTHTLSLVAGFHRDTLVGAAWGASFMLARTEDDGVEARIEEDNWAAAVEWAENSGVKIISSSLGYRDGFTDPSENYKGSDMDGNTTIISRAAAGAAARGVIVVNSMGNEGGGASNNVGTLVAPADVYDVVAVGAVDINRNIAAFSSIGPTADGRIKPDVAAPGVDIPVPNPYADDSSSYMLTSGTSFAAPIVSGIMAMILQANPSITPAEARERLYNSCAFSPRQTFIDNRFGRGIPNALRAIMADSEIFIKFTDSAQTPLFGAQIAVGSKLFTLDSLGYLLTTEQKSALPLLCKISFRGKAFDTFVIDSLPYTNVISIDTKRGSDNLKTTPSIVKRNGVVRGRYLFSGTDVFSPAVATVLTLRGKKVWERKLQIAPDGSAEFEWSSRRSPQKIARGVYFVTVRHGGNMVSEKILITE